MHRLACCLGVVNVKGCALLHDGLGGRGCGKGSN